MLVGFLLIRSINKGKTGEFESCILCPTVLSPVGGFFRALNCDILNKVFRSRFLMQLESRLLCLFVLLREMQAFVSDHFLLTWIPIMHVFLV